VDLTVDAGCWMLTVLPETCMEAEGLDTGMEIPATLGTVVAVTIPLGMVEVAAKNNNKNK